MPTNMNKLTLLLLMKLICLSLISQINSQPVQIEETAISKVFGNTPEIIEIEHLELNQSIPLFLDHSNNNLTSLAKHYKGEGSQFSSISIFKNKLVGIVEIGDTYYKIQKIDNASMTWEAQTDTPSFQCGTNDIPDIELLDTKKIIDAASDLFPNAQARSNSTYELEIDIAVQYELIADFDNDESKLQEAIIARFNTVKDIFINQLDINLILGNLLILEEKEIIGHPHSWFQNHLQEQGVSAPLNHLFYKSNRVEGEAFIGGVCEEGSTSTMSDDLFLDNLIFAHELGHILGSYHTHNCIWPGGEIDSCWTEGAGCLPFQFVDEDAVGGTIMSYCRQPILEFHPLVREFIYGSTRLTTCKDFSDNGQSTAGTIKTQLTYLGKDLNIDGQFTVRAINLLSLSPDPIVFNQDFPIVNGKLFADNIPTYFASYDFFSSDYHAYPNFFTQINTIALPSAPEVRLNVEKKYALDFEIVADDYSGFVRGTPEQVGYQGVVGYYGFETAGGPFDFEDLSKAQLLWRVGPRKYCVVPSSPNYVYDQFPVVSLRDTLKPTKIKAIYKEGANLRVIRFSDGHSHGVGGIMIKLKGPVEKNLISNEVGIAVANDLPAGTYTYEIMDDRYNFMPFGEDPNGETIVISNEFNVFPKRFVASTGAIRVPDRPELMEPANNSMVNKAEEFVLHWIYTIGADQHDLEIALDSSFSQLIHSATIDERLNYFWHSLTTSGTYYWRIRGVSEVGSSEWSDVWSFTISEDVGVDNDGDGFLQDVDCDDTNASINPNAKEVANSGIDENCDGISLIIDEDEDGWNSSIDCDDTNASINPDCNGEDLINTSTHEFGKMVINIFPNPISDFFVINVEGHYDNKLQLKISNIEGKVIYMRELEESNRINLDNQPIGLYIIEISDLKLSKRIIEKVSKVR